MAGNCHHPPPHSASLLQLSEALTDLSAFSCSISSSTSGHISQVLSSLKGIAPFAFPRAGSHLHVLGTLSPLPPLQAPPVGSHVPLFPGAPPSLHFLLTQHTASEPGHREHASPCLTPSEPGGRETSQCPLLSGHTATGGGAGSGAGRSGQSSEGGAQVPGDRRPRSGHAPKEGAENRAGGHSWQRRSAYGAVCRQRERLGAQVPAQERRPNTAILS